MKINTSITDLIGNTPLLELRSLSISLDITTSKIIAKLEGYNPAGSVKDRVGYAMIQAAIKDGTLKDGGTIVEPTSGNTGIAIASMGIALGYKVIIVMPDTMSLERRKIIKSLGASLVLTDGALGTKGAINKAEELLKQNPSFVRLGQFDNMANPKIHRETTGPEIWRDTDGRVDIFVAGVGTGGTISGAGSYLKEQNPKIKVVAVEPSDSAVLSGKGAGPHTIQGIGAGFVPETLDVKVYDEIISIKNEEAFKYAKLVAKTEGLLIGISSGAALAAAVKLAKANEGKHKNIVVIFPDNADRYFSTSLFEN